MGDLQRKARAAGLWNLGLPELADDEPGTRLSNLEYAPLLQRIADRAMQVFGAMGGSDDTPIHQALAWGRLLRIGDGPDEVHLRQIFRMQPMPSWSSANSPSLSAHPS